jgi:hypothetical protein
MLLADRRRRRGRNAEVHLAHYLGLLHRAELELATAFREVAAEHTGEPYVFAICSKLAAGCDRLPSS